MSIGDYRELLIMNRARQLLAMGKLSIGEIAEKLGFSDRFYFSKYFKKRQGITPSAYKSHYVSGSRLPQRIPTTEPATG
jgi:AraC-like DNA-binding protein